MPNVKPTAVAVLAAALAVTGLAGVAAAAPTVPTGPSGPVQTTAYTPALVPKLSKVIASDLNAPWGMAFLPGGGALVAERDSGNVRRLDGKGKAHVVDRVPGVVHAGEGGLLGLAIASDFRKTRWVYAYFTSATDNRIVRMRFENGDLGRPRVVLSGIPKGFIHNGGRLVFGPDGMLYAGTGETGNTGLAQNRKSLGGKILRMTPAGRVPGDNPTKGSYVFSRGHRNVQGLAFDGQGRLIAAEFGQKTWDELNLIKAGRNYGWPTVEGRAGDSRFVDPIAQWHPDKASPSGIAVVKGTVFMAGLRGARLWRIQLGSLRPDGIPRARAEDFFTGRFGRLRTVMAAPDGSLWLTTSNTDGRGNPSSSDDRVLRIRLRAQ
ncbi:PQQ-dependent sugar dehydrogenase [Sporichthya sp.]|uniref:PQQ-dependent sugar dehydrogenase n=1 Tax=Sporichthya sp. TaxID=65475 RepID=UPI0017B1D330|nr:PQQ-dependent sugar dehydrogenase [Sporichthya sp.]MBA3745151.1 PQQ-dependent sugar dehydrogenase [Sporichthya sp.]